MIKHYPYALYLDSKIIGSARQLVSFFEQNIFDKENTIVYLKKYKDSAKIYAQIFSEEGISYKFMKPSELDNLDKQIIFYAFNAQSNCRLVANRKLKHIFITHGESNKIASIKPIIRIYDHVIMAGRLSLERYYRSGLFDEHDYNTSRLIMMGDTFVGRTGFSFDQAKENILFYAPTWEGGLAIENYSSLQNIDLVYSSIVQISTQLNLKSIVIQSHPNLGHRDNEMMKNLLDLLLLLQRVGFKVYFQRNHISLSLRAKFLLSRAGIIFINSLKQFYAKYALVDMSAMESQCLLEKIKYNIFYLEQNLRADLPKDYLKLYQSIGISLDKVAQEQINIDYSFDDIRNKLIDYSQNEWRYLSAGERIFELANVK